MNHHNTKQDARSIGGLVVYCPNRQVYLNTAEPKCQARIYVFEVIILTGQKLVEIVEAELKRRSITKGEFYKACGLSAAVMSNWRRNINFPTVETIKKIGEYLGISFEFGAEENPAPEPGQGVFMPPEFAAIYQKLSPQGKADLDKYARFLLSQEGGI